MTYTTSSDSPSVKKYPPPNKFIMFLEGSCTVSPNSKSLEFPEFENTSLSFWGLWYRFLSFPMCFFPTQVVIFRWPCYWTQPVSALYSALFLPGAFPSWDDLAEKFLRTGHSWCFVIAFPGSDLCVSNAVTRFEHLVKTFKNHLVKILQTRSSCAGESQLVAHRFLRSVGKHSVQEFQEVKGKTNQHIPCGWAVIAGENGLRLVRLGSQRLLSGGGAVRSSPRRAWVWPHCSPTVTPVTQV